MELVEVWEELPFGADVIIGIWQPVWSCILIDTLQHSILGAWLTPTQAGVTPASQTELANPHVDHIVIHRLCA